MRIKRTLQPYVDANKIKFGFGNIALERDLEYSLQNVELVKNWIVIIFKVIRKMKKR